MRDCGEVAVAVVVDAFERHEAAPDAAVAADRERALVAAERAAAHVELGALVVEAVAHDDRHRAADRVETEHRVGADDGHAVDGVVGQEVPVDDVAERLVDAHAVLIDGEALRHAVDGRGLKAAVLQVALEHVALRVLEDDARHRLLQHLGHVGVARALDVARRCARPTRAGELADRNGAAFDRRHLHRAAVDAARAGLDRRDGVLELRRLELRGRCATCFFLAAPSSARPWARAAPSSG